MDGYEIRNYPAKYWVDTKGYSMKISGSIEQSKAFDRLLGYITGDNVEGQVIDMTSPVTHYIIPGAGPNCESNFTMAFFIPEQFQPAPIEPTNPEVFIEYRPAFDAAVIAFDGYASDQDYIMAAVDLYNKASADGYNVQAETWYMVGYDSPFEITNRLNEVWYEIKN